MDKTVITVTRGQGARISTTNANYIRLNTATLAGCPFPNYNAWDLLSDLLKMYSWKLETNTPYTIADFLTACQDAHAVAYRDILTGARA